MTRRGNSSKRRGAAWLWLLVPAGLLIVAGANAHFLYVALDSQPGCVAHSKTAGDGHGYRAAASAC
jgi:hypothetical protein